jgi:CO/xanthine dehydrogenase FAD-binding subunit
MRLSDAAAPAVALAGGQMLLQPNSLRALTGTCLVDIAQLPELRAVTGDDCRCAYGAAVTLSEWADSPGPAAALIPQVLGAVGSRPIRNRATIGGSLAWADPRSEVLQLLWALGATVEIGSAQGIQKQIAVRQFVLDPGRTRLGPGELVLGVSWMRPSDLERWGFEELRLRRSGGRMIVAVIASPPDDEQTQRLTFSGLASTPTELELHDAPDRSHERIVHALEQRIEAARPLSDPNTSLEYRVHAAAELACRLIRHGRA